MEHYFHLDFIFTTSEKAKGICKERKICSIHSMMKSIEEPFLSLIRQNLCHDTHYHTLCYHENYALHCREKLEINSSTTP